MVRNAQRIRQLRVVTSRLVQGWTTKYTAQLRNEHHLLTRRRRDCVIPRGRHVSKPTALPKTPDDKGDNSEDEKGKGKEKYGYEMTCHFHIHWKANIIPSRDFSNNNFTHNPKSGSSRSYGPKRGMKLQLSLHSWTSS